MDSCSWYRLPDSDNSCVALLREDSSDGSVVRTWPLLTLLTLLTLLLLLLLLPLAGEAKFSLI